MEATRGDGIRLLRVAQFPSLWPADSVSSFGTYFGALAAGAIATAFGVRSGLLMGATGMLLAALWLVFSPLRSTTGETTAQDATPERALP